MTDRLTGESWCLTMSRSAEKRIAPVCREASRSIIPIQDVWFDDAATLAMGEAFDYACKSLRNFGPAVPAIIAKRIIAAAKNGERDPARLYEQALVPFGIEDMSMLADCLRKPRSPSVLGQKKDYLAAR